MAIFSEQTITVAGRQLLVSVLVSSGRESIEFVKMEIGDGRRETVSAEMSTLAHSLFDIDISRVEYNSSGIATIRGAFSNTDGRDPFYWRELGVFARRAGTEETPILFAYANSGESADLIGSNEVGTVMEHSIVMSLVIGAASVLTVDNPLATATIADIKDAEHKLHNTLSDHATNTEKHTTQEEKNRWNDTPTKKNLSDHVRDSIPHVSPEERTKWNASAFLPGMILPSACEDMEGWLLCDGRAVSRTEYKNLFDAIKTKYGEGDGKNTFNVPNMQGRTFWGSSASQPLGSMISAGAPDIIGTVGNSCDEGRDPLSWVYADGAFYKGQVSENISEWMNRSRGAHKLKFAASRSNAIYGASDTIQPPAIAFNVFIKY